MKKRYLNLLTMKKIKEKYSNGTLKTLKTYFYKHNIRDNDACQGREF